MARLVLYTLAALATRAYDWTTPDAGLTPFNCTAFPNPIQVLKAAGQSPPYNVSELDLATGEYTKVCPNGFPTKKEVNGFALMQYPGTGPQPSLADNVYGFVCQNRKLQRFDCDSISQVDGDLVQQGNDQGKTCNAATFVGSTYYYTNGLQNLNNRRSRRGNELASTAWRPTRHRSIPTQRSTSSAAWTPTPPSSSRAATPCSTSPTMSCRARRTTSRRSLCGNQNLRRVRAESSRRPPRHRRDACSMAWRCRFLTARPSQDGRILAEKWVMHPTHWLISTQVAR